jgi:hypothetical protein
MSKTVLKLRPSDYWRIGEHESWFTDMAAKGLHLKKMGLIFAKFEKGVPKETRYRIDVSKDRLTDEKSYLYKEYGWGFVTKYGKFNVFSSPKELGAPEIHTDAAEQSYTMEFLDKELRQNLVLMSILMVLFLGMMFGVFFLNSTPFLAMVQGQFLQQCISVIVELYVFYTAIQAFYSIRVLKKSLSEGKPIDHHSKWRKNRWISYAVGGIFIFAACMTIAIPFITILKSESYTLPVGKTDLPIVSLAEIENNPSMLRDIGYINDGVDWGNRLSYDWSPFAPIQYEADERGTVKSQMWNDGSGKYTPSIRSQFYKLTFAGMAGGLINDLQELYFDEYDSDLQIISHPYFDNLHIVDRGENKQIFASLGGNVLYIGYYGYADIDYIITLASEKLFVESK